MSQKSKSSNCKAYAIEAKYKLMFLHGCEMFGDNRVKSFEFFAMLQKEKNKELSKL